MEKGGRKNECSDNKQNGRKSYWYAGESFGNESDGDGYFKYILAAAVIASAIGNIFVVRKMRSFKNLRPHSNSNNNTTTATTTTNNNNNNNADFHSSANDAQKEAWRKIDQEAVFKQQQRETFHASYQNWKKSSYTNNLFRPQLSVADRALLFPHLKALNMPLNTLPSQLELKNAYRKKALSTHPDTSTRKENNSQPASTLQFTEASDAYKNITLILERIENNK